MELKEFDRVMLKDGREATIMDSLGADYVVDVGEGEEDFDTILISAEKIEKVLS